MEIFKQIKGFPKYQVSNYGHVLSKKHGNRWKELTLQKDSMGYYHVRLYKDDNTLGVYENGKKIPKLYKVHTLVLNHFKPTDNPSLVCNHKDGCKTNNHIDNLEWVTQAENVQHAWDNNLYTIKPFGGGGKSKKVMVTFPDGKKELYNSRKECAKHLNCDVQTVTNSITRNAVSRKGKFKGVAFANV